MEDWSASSLDLGHSIEDTKSSRILATISGNARHQPISHRHLDFSKPFVPASRAVSEPQCLAPHRTLGSNDKQSLNHRLAAHKARRSSQPYPRGLQNGSHLLHPKYIEYLSRKRQDIGKDGRAIWPAHVERAFQNALMNIPPMGKTKRTQRGKLLGRNELIEEWIFQETGESRDRKQISSHIQNLGQKFKSVPEWLAITKGWKDKGDDIPDAGPDYYYESIADQVRLRRELARESDCNNDDQAAWAHFEFSKANVASMTFKMWVSMPDKVFSALHSYTQILNTELPASMTPLENYENWRDLFPDLEALLPANDEDPFDVVLLKSKFKLMSDYPPATSKLVLDLDVDLRDSRFETLLECGQMKYFSSINHMYHNGKLLQKSEHKDCQALEPGVAKPFFEADWWAAQFTELTRRKKDAEDTKDDAEIATSEESSRGFFRGLTIMQEIFVSRKPSELSTVPRKRVAVLLWVFAQEQKEASGVTTWQKVIVPPARYATLKSPPTGAKSCFMDESAKIAVDEITDLDFASTHLDIQPSTAMSPVPYDSMVYHSGFTPYHGMGPLTGLESSNTGFTPKIEPFAEIKPEPINFKHPLKHVLQFLPSHATMVNQLMQGFAGQPESLYSGHNHLGMQYVEQEESPDRTGHRTSLANFDMSTHDMLQAQLGNFDHDFGQSHDSEDMDLIAQDPDSQQSVTGHFNDLELDCDDLSQAMLTGKGADTPTLNEQKLMLDHPTLFTSPKVTRPPLLSHNSFAGVLHSHEPEDDVLAFDTPTRNEFARVISGHLDVETGNHVFGPDAFAMTESYSLTHEPARPRSQPILPSNDYSKMDLLELIVPSQLHPALPELEAD